ncbi:hypothetical protein UFOVP447_156 [uncultured Caudovirales phage]|uniref:Uncharacterized protein n=1 Tax=uncultured Caudovirales phage TaxID=2100421 RepID=A0A6J5MB38_9CAUD|nr:hypothetical protein UFOVP447_156 [uncultured Caudovirales phage]
MGKKRTRSTTVSKGERRNIVAGVKEARRSRSEAEKALNKIEAWRAGKNPWITVPGPSSNMRFVRVKANNLYGDPRYAMANIYGNRKGDE